MTPFKKLVFGSSAQETLIGKKCGTIRKYRPEAHTFSKGETVIGEFADGLTILLSITEDTALKPFKDLTDEDAQLSGLSDSKSPFEALQEYYPGLALDDTAAVIEYKVFEVEGVPVVRWEDEEE